MNAVIPRARVARTPEPSTGTRKPNDTTLDPTSKPECDPQWHLETHRHPRHAAPRRLPNHAVTSEHQAGHVGQCWGRAGERFAAAKLGLRLCRNCAQGHDGRMGNELVEIKTITPYKRRRVIRVKRSGNFSLLAVVRFSGVRAELRLVRRSRLPKGNGGAYLALSWSRACALAEPVP